MKPLFTITSSIIAIFSFILMIIFYLKSKNVKKPFYIIKSVNLVRNLVSNIDLLEMTFKGYKVSNLTISKLFFGNVGRDTIRSDDIAKADPLTISIKDDFKILDAKIIYSKNPANSFCITDFNNDHFKIDFDFIDKNEGSIIQIIHTGISNWDLNLNGTIKGAGNPLRKEVFTNLYKLFHNYSLDYRVQNPIKFFKILGIGIAIYIILFVILLTISIYTSSTNKILMVILGILAGSIFVGAVYLTLLFFTARKIPRGFESFWDEF